MAALKTLVFIILVPGFVVFFLPYKVAVATPPAATVALGSLRYAAVLAVAVGAGSLLWSAWAFASKGRGTPAPIDPPKELVAEGLYVYVRNPMYVGALSVVTGQFLWFGSLWLVVYGGAALLAFHLFIVFYEEPTLRKQFGNSYVEYCQRVPRWIPRVRK